MMGTRLPSFRKYSFSIGCRNQSLSSGATVRPARQSGGVDRPADGAGLKISTPLSSVTTGTPDGSVARSPPTMWSP